MEKQLTSFFAFFFFIAPIPRVYDQVCYLGQEHTSKLILILQAIKTACCKQEINLQGWSQRATTELTQLV